MSAVHRSALPERLLLHICCGPCACGAVPFFKNQGVEVIGLFFNPNIHPLLEFRRRLTAAQEAAEFARIQLRIDDSYDPETWFKAVTFGQYGRCEACVAMRLRRAAEEAAAQECEAFSTTLSISSWQDHEAIKTWGDVAGREHGVRFVYEDLRRHYAESYNLSRRIGLYRQKYCGCLVSEWQRYRADA